MIMAAIMENAVIFMDIAHQLVIKNKFKNIANVHQQHQLMNKVLMVMIPKFYYTLLY